MKEPLFLTLAEVIEIHNDQIKRYGGSAAVRDLGLLQSAISQPSASFSGQWLHDDIFIMAAAYASISAVTIPLSMEINARRSPAPWSFCRSTASIAMTPRENCWRRCCGWPRANCQKKTLPNF